MEGRRKKYIQKCTSGGGEVRREGRGRESDGREGGEKKNGSV